MLSKIDAVNIILDVIGEDPVNSLTSGLPDAEKAERFLDRVSKVVQSQGWHCNTDSDWPLTPNSENKIIVASDVLSIDASGPDKWRNVVVREDPNEAGIRLLYDVDNQTYTFTKAIKADVTWLLDWTSLTPALQYYIAYRAAKEFQESEMGSVALDSFAVKQSAMAFFLLLENEADNEESNMLVDSAQLRRTTRRNNPLYGLKG